MKNILNFVCITAILFSITIGCGTVGTAFDQKGVNLIKIGTTTKEDIRKFFGKPFRTGIENDREVWVYEHNTYSTFSSGFSKDLIVVFDYQDTVYSYQIMSSSP